MVLDTLVLTSLVGILVMALELLNARKVIIPLVVLSLIGILIHQIGFMKEGSYFNGMLVYENISKIFISILLIIGILIISLSSSYYKNQETLSDYISLKVFILSGAIAMVYFQNIIIFFIGLEILSIGFYALAGSQKNNILSNESGMKYFLMGSFASAIFLLGMTFIYAVTGTFDVTLIGQKLAIISPEMGMLVQMGMLLMLVALLFKTSVAPFHLWSPDVYQGAPMMTTAMLGTLSKVAALGAFFKFAYYGMNDFISDYPLILMTTAMLSMLIGSIAAVKQKNIKRILAFSGISNAGFMIIPMINSHEAISLSAIGMYAFAYSVGSLVVFAIALNSTTNYEDEELSAFNGLAKKNYLAALSVTIALLSMSGIPPLIGFFAKYQVIYLAIQNNIAVAIVAIISSFISVYVYFRIIWAMYTKDSDGKEFAISTINLAVAIIGALTLILGSIFSKFVF